MPQDGWKSYFIIGEQSAYATQLATSDDMIDMIYEPISMGFAPSAPLIVPDRASRIASPLKGIPGMISAVGNLSMHAHFQGIVPLLKHWLHDDTEDLTAAGTNFTAQEVYGNGAGAGTDPGTGPISLNTQPGATTPVSSPGKLILTFDSNYSGNVTIAGTHQGRAISEIITFATETTKTSTKFYETVNAIGISFSADPTGNNLLITCDRDIYTRTLVPRDGVLEGLTVEELAGTIPNTYHGMLVNSGQITLGETAQLALELIGRGFALQRNITGGASATSVSAYRNVSEEVVGNWGASLEITGLTNNPLPIADLSFSVNNGLSFPTANKTGTQFYPKPIRNASKREVSLVATIDYDVSPSNDLPDFQSDHLNNVTFGCTAKYIFVPYNGPKQSIQIAMTRCELADMPTRADGVTPDLTQGLTIRPVRSVGASTPDEFTITVESTEQTADTT